MWYCRKEFKVVHGLDQKNKKPRSFYKVVMCVGPGGHIYLVGSILSYNLCLLLGFKQIYHLLLDRLSVGLGRYSA